MIKCICINDKKKPREIPFNKWIKKGYIYTVIYVQHTLNAESPYGVTLSEIELTQSENPYDSFGSNRFAFKEEDILKVSQLAEECYHLNNIDLTKLLP